MTQRILGGSASLGHNGLLSPRAIVVLPLHWSFVTNTYVFNIFYLISNLPQVLTLFPFWIFLMSHQSSNWSFPLTLAFRSTAVCWTRCPLSWWRRGASRCPATWWRPPSMKGWRPKERLRRIPVRPLMRSSPHAAGRGGTLCQKWPISCLWCLVQVWDLLSHRLSFHSINSQSNL